jgi:hypothetical protein
MKPEEVAVGLATVTASVEHLTDSLVSKFKAMHETGVLKDEASNMRHTAVLAEVKSLKDGHVELAEAFILHMQNEEKAMAKIYRLGWIGLGGATLFALLLKYPQLISAFIST